MIFHGFDVKNKQDSYWVSFGDNCVLIAGQHLRHAEMEELIAHEDFASSLGKLWLRQLAQSLSIQILGGMP